MTDTSPSSPTFVLVMGVSGCGKSTVGQAIAQALGLPYLEGDAFHPPANVERMRAGIALTDEDRAGWLRTLSNELRARRASGGAVLACSALKRRYRDVLRRGVPGGDCASSLGIVWLHGEPALLAQRLLARPNHYMPASLLQSQLHALEPPDVDEGALRVDIAEPIDRIVACALQHLNKTR